LEDQQYAEAFRSRLGFVFQNTDAQLFSPTVRDELAFGPLNMGLDQDDVVGRGDESERAAVRRAR
jgi:cobalt/nickel transport system ATP-binding protein